MDTLECLNPYADANMIFHVNIENEEVLQNIDPSENLVLMILRDDNVYYNNTGTGQKVYNEMFEAISPCFPLSRLLAFNTFPPARLIRQVFCPTFYCSLH